jgi:hypothetical protein
VQVLIRVGMLFPVNRFVAWRRASESVKLSLYGCHTIEKFQHAGEGR